MFYVVCVSFIHELRSLQFNVDSEKLFHDKFIYSQSFFSRNLLRGNRRRNIFFINFALMADGGRLVAEEIFFFSFFRYYVGPGF